MRLFSRNFFVAGSRSWGAPTAFSKAAGAVGADGATTVAAAAPRTNAAAAAPPRRVLALTLMSRLRSGVSEAAAGIVFIVE